MATGGADRQSCKGWAHTPTPGLKTSSPETSRYRPLVEPRRNRYIAAMPPLLIVMIGGAIGAGFRFHISTAALRNLGPGFPWGTWIVNLIGGLMMGILAGALAKQFTPAEGEPLRLFLGAGVLGGFTTFSAFSLESANMLLRGDAVMAAAYAVSSVVGSVLMLFLGLFLMRALG
jgi:CrcB protein